jgi:hypothetical protein
MARPAPLAEQFLCRVHLPTSNEPCDLAFGERQLYPSNAGRLAGAQNFPDGRSLEIVDSHVSTLDLAP